MNLTKTERKSALRRFPWRSAFLLLLAYTVFGKFLCTFVHPQLVWPFAIAWGLLLAVLFMDPLTGIRSFLTRWFQSDTVAFTTLIMAAALVSILLNWLKVFLPVIVIIAAEALARLDIQNADFNNGQAFWILTAISLLGLGTGWAIGQYI